MNSIDIDIDKCFDALLGSAANIRGFHVGASAEGIALTTYYKIQSYTLPEMIDIHILHMWKKI